MKSDRECRMCSGILFTLGVDVRSIATLCGRCREIPRIGQPARDPVVVSGAKK